jgi:hypothetical protein
MANREAAARSKLKAKLLKEVRVGNGNSVLCRKPVPGRYGAAHNTWKVAHMLANTWKVAHMLANTWKVAHMLANTWKVARMLANRRAAPACTKLAVKLLEVMRGYVGRVAQRWL